MSQQEVLKETLYKYLDEFYKLKDQYETEFNKKIIKPILTSVKAKSMKEKRKLLRDAPKARCVNCKRNVGTLFSIKYVPGELDDSESYRQFIAKCGDSSDPCPLNINLKVYKVYTFENKMNKLEETINRLKKEIIYEKNKMVFGYSNIEESGEHFAELTSDLENYVEYYNNILQLFVKRIEDPERQDELKKLIITYGANIDQVKVMIKEYLETGSQEIVDNVVSMYIDELIPLNNKIMDFKYHINMVEIQDGISYLIQQRNTIQDTEINENVYKKPDEIISQFVVGIVEKSKTKRRTIKAVETKQNITKRATINLEEDSPPIKIESSPTKVEAKVTATNVVKETKTTIKPTIIFEEEESPPIIIESSSLNNSALLVGEKPVNALFSEQALNDAYNLLEFDEQMRILDLEEPQRTEEMRKLINI